MKQLQDKTDGNRRRFPLPLIILYAMGFLLIALQLRSIIGHGAI